MKNWRIFITPAAEHSAKKLSKWVAIDPDRGNILQ